MNKEFLYEMLDTMSVSGNEIRLQKKVIKEMTTDFAAHQASLSITNSQSLHKLMSIKLVMPSNHLILCRPLPTFNLSQHQGLFK